MNDLTKENRQYIIEQWAGMIQRGTMPLFELEIQDESGEEDYLLVSLTCGSHGIYFNFDDVYSTAFDEDIEHVGSQYLLPFDEYTDSLDSMLEYISDNLTEGYILPNNLFRNEV